MNEKKRQKWNAIWVRKGPRALDEAGDSLPWQGTLVSALHNDDRYYTLVGGLGDQRGQMGAVSVAFPSHSW